MAKYASDLNPIEQVFVKLKHWLRTSSERTRDTVCIALAQILDSISAAASAIDLVTSGCDRT